MAMQLVSWLVQAAVGSNEDDQTPQATVARSGSSRQEREAERLAKKAEKDEARQRSKELKVEQRGLKELSREERKREREEARKAKAEARRQDPRYRERAERRERLQLKIASLTRSSGGGAREMVQARLQEELEKQMEQALQQNDADGVEVLLDEVLQSRMNDDGTLPRWSTEAAQRAAENVLRQAIEAAEPRRLKAALLTATRLQATGLPEYAAALAKYKEVHSIPAGWDVASMINMRWANGNRMLVQPNMSHDYQLRNLFQLLFDRTTQRAWTRDRGDVRIPDRLEVVDITEVQNDDNWTKYMMRQKAISNELGPILEPGGEAPDFDGVLMLDAHAATTKAIEQAQGLIDSEARVAPDAAGAAGSCVPCAVTDLDGPLYLHMSPDAAQVAAAEVPMPVRDLLATALPGPPLNRQANEAWLFHGTSAAAAANISETNFRLDLAGTCTGSLFGRGIYTAENWTKADEYSRREPTTGNYAMLVCRVSLGLMLYEADVNPEPRACEDACLSGPCHSILGDRTVTRGTFREFVVFDEDQVYPNYVVHYKRIYNDPPGSGR